MTKVNSQNGNETNLISIFNGSKIFLWRFLNFIAKFSTNSKNEIVSKGSIAPNLQSGKVFE